MNDNTSDFFGVELTGTRKRWIYALSAGIAVAYVILFFLSMGRIGPKDYDQFLVFHELQYWNAALFGFAKQWTPVMCAGLSLAGEPQVPFMSLSMLLGYMLGPLRGLELAVALYFVIGWIGSYLYAGLLLGRPAQRALAASLFVGNGFFFCRLGYGHIDCIPFLILPLVLWSLHQAANCSRGVSMRSSTSRLMALLLLLAAATSVAIDGSPVAIIHLYFWIALYTAILSITIRSVIPAALFVGACGLAALLDAGYLWPMLVSQEQFPRRMPDTFTNPMALLWHLIMPVRGKLFHANGKGHELNVFIGPVLAYLLWRYRRRWWSSVPAEMKYPLLVVSVVSLWLGMGSLHELNIPHWLSPFDLLRPLPGFRSLNVTGRFWGFLALPLSLLAAAALWRFIADCEDSKRVRLWMVLVLLLQLGFMTQTVASHWLPGRPYAPVPVQGLFQGNAETITYLRREKHEQGEFITPTRAVVDCYDMDEFIRFKINPGEDLIQSALLDGAALGERPPWTGKFLSWSRIRLTPDAKTTAATSLPRNATLQLILNQAYHPLWRAPGCEVTRTQPGNLALSCSVERFAQGPVDLEFRDALSDRAAQVSRLAWHVWLLGALAAAALLLFIRRHPVYSPPEASN